MKQKILLFTLYISIWTVLALHPWYRNDWLLENILVFIALPILIWSDRKTHFSTASALMLFLFFVLHAVGAHYTYSEMPWFSPITHFFGFERNHYDRLVHFLFGFLLFLPFYEFFNSFQRSAIHTFLFTSVFLIAASGIYEVIEWVTTKITHPDLGIAFLGVQGDQWDAQKDMACGYFGTLLASLVWYRPLLKENRIKF
ncbi:MAG: DUF2238 domain-containing protein [Campylobacterales bacterium]|nr:DUF2238 domain-containing protein [Campylobacterales bacterium]